MYEVLVPIDFSEESVIALEYGIALANHLNANLRVIHVKCNTVILPFFAEENAKYRLDHNVDMWAKELYEKYKSRYKVKNGYFDYKIREGNVIKEITNQAKYGDSSVLVVATHNNKKESKWVGSDAYRLVSHSPCPVVVVNKRMKLKYDIKSIVVPVDYSIASRKKVPAVTGMAYLFDAKVHVVGLKSSDLKWMNDEMSVFVKQVKEYITKNAHVNVESDQIAGREFAKNLMDYADKVDADMLTVHVHHSNNPFVRLFQPFTNELVNNSLKPVLVIPTKD